MMHQSLHNNDKSLCFQQCDHKSLLGLVHNGQANSCWQYCWVASGMSWTLPSSSEAWVRSCSGTSGTGVLPPEDKESPWIRSSGFNSFIYPQQGTSCVITITVTSCWARWRLKSPPLVFFLNRVFGRKSKKTSKVGVTGLCEGNSPVTGEFPAQRASNAENVSTWWRHDGLIIITLHPIKHAH